MISEFSGTVVRAFDYKDTPYSELHAPPPGLIALVHAAGQSASIPTCVHKTGFSQPVKLSNTLTPGFTLVLVGDGD